MSSYYNFNQPSFEDILQTERQNLPAYVQSREPAVYKLVYNIPLYVVSIDRSIIGGSIGKGTSLGPNSKPDFDVNLFIDGAAPNSSNQYLETYLYNARQRIFTYLKNKCRHVCKVLYSGPMSVGVYLYSIQANVDLIPAINFGGGGNLQYEAILNRLVNANANLSWANVCYAEESVRFVANKGEFSKNVVRLAKYWNKRCVKMGNPPLSGRSVIVETVALKAAQDEMNRWGNQMNLRNALERFFKYFNQPMHSVRVVVPYDKSNDWLDPVRWRMYNWGRGQSGYLVDPVNPYRNFLEDANLQAKWQCFREAARSSLQKLNAGQHALAIGF